MVSVTVACASSSDGEPSTQDAASSKESGAALALEGSGTSRCDREGVELRMEQFADALANADVRTLRRLWGRGSSGSRSRSPGRVVIAGSTSWPTRPQGQCVMSSGRAVYHSGSTRCRGSVRWAREALMSGLQEPGRAAAATHRDLSPARAWSTVTPRRSRSQASACHRPTVLRRREFEPVRAPDRARAWRGTLIILAAGSRPGRGPYRHLAPATSSLGR